MDKIIWIVIGAAVLLFGGYWVLGTSSIETAHVSNDSSVNIAGTSDAYNTTSANGSSSVAATEPGSEGSSQQASSAGSGQITTNKKYMQATLHTNKGDITIEFFDADAPSTVTNFIKLAGEGFYDGTKFHRVIQGFMIQGGDPLSKDDSMVARWGTGGPGYQFADEIRANNHNNIGTISMANAGPNTNGSQFFINVANNNFLDTKHTTFGKVTSGLDVVSAIENTQTGANDRPVEPIIINSITLK